MLNCCSDCGVCCMGTWCCGCRSALFASNVRAVGTESYDDAFIKFYCMASFVPGWLIPIADLSTISALIVSPVITLAHWGVSYYGMTRRQQLRKKYGIVGKPYCCCSCLSFFCDGDELKLDDFCIYHWCFPLALCQEQRHLKRHGVNMLGAPSLNNKLRRNYSRRYTPVSEGHELAEGVRDETQMPALQSAPKMTRSVDLI